MCCFFVWSSSPKVGTQSLSSHCVDQITPSATRMFRTTLFTRCVSLGVPLLRTLWRSSLRILVAVSSSSLLARCLDCCSLLDGHQRWFTHRCYGPVSQFSLTTFRTHSTSCSSVRQVSHSVMIQTPFSCSRLFTVAGRDVSSKFLCTDVTEPVKVRIMSFSVIHSMVLFPSCATCSPLADTFALDDTAQLSREHSTLLLSRLLPRFVGCLHIVCMCVCPMRFYVEDAPSSVTLFTSELPTFDQPTTKCPLFDRYDV